MTKQYKILKVKTKRKEIPDGYHTTLEWSHKLVETGYGCLYDTLEEAEEQLAREIEPFETFTIIPIYNLD